MSFKRRKIKAFFDSHWLNDRKETVKQAGRTFEQQYELEKCWKRRVVNSCKDCIRYNEECERRIINNG